MAETNVKYAVKGNVLTITCDIGPAAINRAQPSGTGKTLTVSGTGGFVKVPGTDLSLSLNLAAKNPDYVKV